MTKIVLALDLGGTNLRVAAVGSDGTIYSRSRAETPNRAESGEILELILKLADDCRTAGPEGSKVIAFAAAVPASINDVEGTLVKLPNLPQLEGVNLRHTLGERLGVPVIIENDANAAALGENWVGASQGHDDSICITLGTGVGGGIIIAGRLLRGKDGSAGEIGHMCVEPEGVPCGCGSRGCLEQYTSATALVRIATESGLIVKNSREVYDAAISNDGVALSVFHQMGAYLGIGIGNLINLLNPETIVIGGGMSAAFEIFAGSVADEAGRRAYREPFERVKIVRAQMGDDAGILGAARSAFEKGM